MKMRHVRVLASTVGALLAAMAMLAGTATAAEPAPGFERFAGCPSPDENSEVAGCSRTVIDGGHFQMGSKSVPISKPMALVGGILPDGHVVANSKGGLSPVKQQVPGGVIGITGLDWLVNFLGVDALQLFAVTELAGAPFLGGETLELPLRVRLVNPVLGNNCYVGSVSNPIELHLTTETTNPPPPNKPITGVGPTFSFDEFGVSHFDNGQFVDNSFAAPGASGCKLTLLGFIPVSLDGLVNQQAGLPSPAGTNETRQNFDLEIAGVPTVYP